MHRRNWMASVARLAVKDIRVGRRFLWVVVPMYLAYGAALFVSTEVFVFVNGLFIFFLAAAPVLLDLRHNADLLFCSLPVPRSAIVAGRYAGSALIVAIGMTACLGYGSLLKLLIPGVSASFSVASVAGKLVPVGAGALVFVCAFYPLVFKYGLGKAISLFIFSVLGAGALGLIAGGVMWVDRHGSLAGYRSEAVAMAILRIATDTQGAWQHIGRVGAAAVFVSGAAGVLLVSCSLSIRFYGRRDF